MARTRHRRIVGAAMLVGSLTLAAPFDVISAATSISGGTPRQVRMVEWAFRRFESAELTLPAIEVAFHDDPTGCAGNTGFFRDGRVDLCIGDEDSAYARKAIVHELAHAWIDQNVSAPTRRRFLHARTIESWNDQDQPWGMRGYEQAAEVITWFVGPGLTPIIPERPDPAELGSLYRSLTGDMVPELSGSG